MGSNTRANSSPETGRPETARPQTARPQTARPYLCLWFALLAFAASSSAAQASSDELFGASLGNWLREDAQTKLSSLLSTHPRFRGERIQVVAMRDGSPAVDSDELTQAIRLQLTHRLAQIKGVQLAWGEATGQCSIPKKTPYLLGVEVVRESRSRHLVQVAMVDVEEGIWVSGAHLQWRGQLTSGERRALQVQSLDGPGGTIDKPLASGNRVAVVERLEKQIQCSIDKGLDGDVHIAAFDETNPLLVDLATKLRARLLRSASLIVAQNSNAVDWHLRLVAVDDLSKSVVATLTAVRKGKPDSSSAQRLAAVYISGPMGQAGPETPEMPASVASLDRELLSAITEQSVSPGETCYQASERCLEVGFELYAPAYVLVLRNSGGVMHLGSCALPRKTSGLKRYRLAASTADGSNVRKIDEISLYAIATSDRVLVRELHATLSSAAANCGARGSGESRKDRGKSFDWLARLDALIGPAADRVQWQAFFSPSDHQAIAGLR